MNQSEKLLNCPEDLRYKFGEFIEFYELDTNAKMTVYKNPQLFGLHDRIIKNELYGAHYGFTIISRILQKWKTNSIFSSIKDANKRWSQPDDIDLYEYLTTTNFHNILSCRILYDKMCKYLYKELEYQTSMKKINPDFNYNYWLICKFFVEIFSDCLEASKIYQSVFLYNTEMIFYSTFYDMNQSLIYWCMQYLPDRDEMYVNIANELYSLYTIYKYDYGYLTRNACGLDLYMTTFLKNNSDHQQWIDNLMYQTVIKLVAGGKDTLPIMMHESTNDISETKEFVFKDSSGYIDTSITFFGDKNLSTSFLGRMSVEGLKRNLIHLSADEIKRYIKKDDNTKIIFTIPEQFKSYLHMEIECQMIVVNLKKGNELQQTTILSYEGEKFVLFISADEPDVLYGISLEENPDTEERRIFTMNKDEEITYRFSFDELNE